MFSTGLELVKNVCRVKQHTSTSSRFVPDYRYSETAHETQQAQGQHYMITGIGYTTLQVAEKYRDQLLAKLDVQTLILLAVKELNWIITVELATASYSQPADIYHRVNPWHIFVTSKQTW